jgi:hypothetical protein
MSEFESTENYAGRDLLGPGADILTGENAVILGRR